MDGEVGSTERERTHGGVHYVVSENRRHGAHHRSAHCHLSVRTNTLQQLRGSKKNLSECLEAAADEKVSVGMKIGKEVSSVK